jgi:putative transposase
MADAISPATGRHYGVARVCHVWKVPRSSFYAAHQASAEEAGPRSSPAGTVVNFVFGAVRCR